MDPSRFDHFARVLSSAGARRAVLRALLGAVLGGAATETHAKKRGKGQAKSKDRDRANDQGRGSHSEQRLHAEGRGKRRKKTRKKRRGGSDGGQTEPPPPECCGTESCPDPEPGSTSAGCDFAGRAFVGQDHNGSIFRGIDGRNAVFIATDNHGSIFAEACLQGASFRRAKLGGSTWGDACLFDADFTGADLGGDSAVFQGALFCRTTMPDGSVNDRDCGTADLCCDPELGAGAPCRSAPDCGNQVCRTTACVNDQCVFTPVADGQSPNDLCDGHCCEGVCCPSGATECNPQGICCTPNCAGRTCGPDGCGGTCGTCPPGTACFEESGTCICNPGTCNGCCTANQTICVPGTTRQACGSGGAPCATCSGQQVCHNAQCCTPNCAGKQCGPDGCGGSCGNCQQGQRCQNGQCVCDAQSCASGCCDAIAVCQPGTANQACGTGGNRCATCGSGQGCINRTCAVCNAATCPQGCCAANNTCQPGNTFQNCGGPGGERCAACSNTQTCQNRQCVECGNSCPCSGQSICFDANAPNVVCPLIPSTDLGECFVTLSGQPVCSSNTSDIGCNSNADCGELAPNAVCVQGKSPGSTQTQCDASPSCVVPGTPA
jgi:hypothetical protein